MQKSIILLFFLFLQTAFGQHAIKGSVKNKDGKSLENIHIHIGNITTTTDVAGNYIVSNISSGKHVIDFSAIGYFEKDVEINLKENITLDVVLFEDSKAIEEINVARNSSFSRKTLTRKENVISTDQIERNNNNSLGETLSKVTGVTILKTGNSVAKPIIGGLHSNRVVILNQGVRMEDQQWGAEHSPTLDVNAAGKITVIKGSSALQYGGDALGGFVIVEPLKITKDTLFGKTIISGQTNGMGGTINTGIYLNKKTGFNYSAEGTFRYLGDRKSANYILTNTGNREQNFAFSIGHQTENNKAKLYYSLYNATNGILSAAHIGNINDLYNSIANQTPFVVEPFSYNINNPKQKIKHHLFKISNELTLANYQMNFQYAFQNNLRQEFDVRRAQRKETPALDMTLKTHSFSADVSKKHENFNFKLGSNFSYQENVSNPETGIRPLIPTFNKTDFGLFATANYQENENTFFDFGLRYDFSEIEATKYYLKSRWIERNYNVNYASFFVQEVGTQILTKPNFSYTNISANVGFKKIFHHGYKAYVNLNLANRNPNVNELFSDGLHQSNGQIELGDLALKKEQATKLSTTITKEGNFFSFEVSPYLNKINNFIFLQPTGLENTIRGAFPTWQYKQTNALLAGIDVNMNLTFNTIFSHDIGFAYVYGIDQTNNNYLIDMPPFKLVNTFKIDQTNNKKFNYLVEIKSEFVAMQNNFPNYNFIAAIIENNALKDVEVPISTPPKAYHLLGIYAQTKQIIFKTKTTFSVSVDNLLNVAYRDYLNRQRFFADDLGRNITFQIKFNY